VNYQPAQAAKKYQVSRLLVTASVVPSSLILSTFMMEALGSSETSVLTRTTWRHIPEDGILQTFLLILVSSDKMPTGVTVNLMLNQTPRQE
jgi:hypothetical protein